MIAIRGKGSISLIPVHESILKPMRPLKLHIQRSRYSDNEMDRRTMQKARQLYCGVLPLSRDSSASRVLPYSPLSRQIPPVPIELLTR